MIETKIEWNSIKKEKQHHLDIEDNVLSLKLNNDILVRCSLEQDDLGRQPTLCKFRWHNKTMNNKFDKAGLCYGIVELVNGDFDNDIEFRNRHSLPVIQYTDIVLFFKNDAKEHICIMFNGEIEDEYYIIDYDNIIFHIE